jgi:cold shock CspA family protein
MALIGSVTRWFNRKGYGFINVMNSDSENVGQDMFVHLSGINISNDGYKSLYPGEYVSFDLDKTNDGRLTCVNVTGVLGGPLLVEHPQFRYKYFQRNPHNRDDNRDDNSANRSGAENVNETAEEQVDETAEEQVDETGEVHTDENDPEQ